MACWTASAVEASARMVPPTEGASSLDASSLAGLDAAPSLCVTPGRGPLFAPGFPRLRDLCEHLRHHRLGPGMYGQIAQRDHADQLLVAVQDE